MTFSILAQDKNNLGIGVVSGSFKVRERVPWVKEKIGAVATQGYTEIRYGKIGIKLLENGKSPIEILRKLTREDPEPEKRQVAILDKKGRGAFHTGQVCPEKKDSKEGKKCIAVGNMLKNKKVVQLMGSDFEKSDVKDLSLRILNALKAGVEAGGDLRGNRTAAIVVKGEENIDIGIDNSNKLLKELSSRYER